MSIQDFDNLTAALADRAISRRRALQMAAASALGVAGLGLAAGEAHASHGTCPRRRAGCCRDCRNDAGKSCRCIRKTNGDRTCVYPCCEPNATEVEGCNRDGQCSSDNEVCMRTSCCGDPPGDFEGVCVRRCRASRDFDCNDRGAFDNC